MSDTDNEKAVVDAITALLTALGPLDAEARVHVIEFVVKRLGIKLPGDSIAAALVSTKPELAGFGAHGEHLTPLPGASEANNPPPRPAHVVDVRSFAEGKNPQTMSERVAVIAYYLAHEAAPADRKDRLTWDDIEPYFKQAGFPLPTASHMALTNAKNAGYLVPVDRGQYKLNAVGHNLVAHKLPAGEGGSERRRRPARKGGKGKSKPKRKA